MSGAAPFQIVVAGAGVAGLTAALAFASRGFTVQIFERAPELEEVGAGLQLSPNATRLLKRIGVLDDLLPVAVAPESVILRDGRTLQELARVPLGKYAEKRWGAPYLVAHRADLQSALLARIGAEPKIRLTLDAQLRGADNRGRSPTVSVETGGRINDVPCEFLVGADGVHSATRKLVSQTHDSNFGREIAWRLTVETGSLPELGLSDAVSGHAVTAFLRPDFHLIAYPVRAGAAVNLVAFTKAASLPRPGASPADGDPARKGLADELARCAPPLRALARNISAWKHWPIHVADAGLPWTSARGVALIGDAAHAMTPYAAQGAAMAIEDAVTLADAVSAGPDRIGATLATWERERRTRIAAVARRAAFNRFAWHAAGPIALARNLVLAMRSRESLAADMDWLYGWKPGATL
ncbi:FAD-dependent monooxygenase [Arvimicrobium flavum]|uniref:FAD-dependent monooxygenase n=1 Tax=Arvimicrobium flavum TaxID=3393320 RepID=UPI00237B3DF1|nr:FAD-dependent monooxygenase [Mesorhizobium shangrilense]